MKICSFSYCRTENTTVTHESEFELPLLGKFTIFYLVVWARPSRKLSSFNYLSKTSSSELLSIWNKLFQTCLYIRMYEFSNDSKTFILGQFYCLTRKVWPRTDAENLGRSWVLGTSSGKLYLNFNKLLRLFCDFRGYSEGQF